MSKRTCPAKECPAVALSCTINRFQPHVVRMAQSVKILSTSFLVLFVVLLLYLVFAIFAPFLTPIMWSLILARLFYPVHERLARFVRGKRAISAMLMTLAVMILVVLPVSYVTLF